MCDMSSALISEAGCSASGNTSDQALRIGSSVSQVYSVTEPSKAFTVAFTELRM